MCFFLNSFIIYFANNNKMLWKFRMFYFRTNFLLTAKKYGFCRIKTIKKNILRCCKLHNCLSFNLNWFKVKFKRNLTVVNTSYITNKYTLYDWYFCCFMFWYHFQINVFILKLRSRTRETLKIGSKRERIFNYCFLVKFSHF